METINQKSPDDRAYIAGLNNRKIGLYARSLAAGKKIALEYFQPTHRRRDMVWIAIAHEEG